MSIDYERARLVPGAVFASPWDVVTCNELTRDQKIDVLLRWAYDAAEIAVAVEEGMPNGEDDLQGQIQLGLKALQEQIDAEHTGPTKHHGLPRL